MPRCYLSITSERDGRFNSSDNCINPWLYSSYILNFCFNFILIKKKNINLHYTVVDVFQWTIFQSWYIKVFTALGSAPRKNPSANNNGSRLEITINNVLIHITLLVWSEQAPQSMLLSQLIRNPSFNSFPKGACAIPRAINPKPADSAGTREDT